VNPCDVIQGGVGNCWLISAISCLAEFHGPIHNLFENRGISVYGKYTVNLYNKSTNKWEKITVDDKIPYSKSTNKPFFAQSCENEIWVCILEKAFAKFVGNYSMLKGGNVAWALQAMTGDNVFKFTQNLETRTWTKQNIINISKDTKPSSLRFVNSNEKYDTNQMFEIFKEYDYHDSMLAAYIVNNNEWKKSNGIIAGHAYSILQVVEIYNFKLLQLRNPWGKFEWNGDWSDQSKLWKIHPYVTRNIKNENKNDGVFWMNWHDFQSIFTDVDICHRSTGIHDLVLDIHEECDLVGPIIGCTKGCFNFWCCCKGCKAIYYPTTSKKETLHIKKNSYCVLL